MWPSCWWYPRAMRADLGERLLASYGEMGEAMAAEAMAAGEEGETEGRARNAEEELQADEAVVGASGGPLPIAPAHSPWFARAVFASVVAIIALLVSRGCR